MAVSPAAADDCRVRGLSCKRAAPNLFRFLNALESQQDITKLSALRPESTTTANVQSNYKELWNRSPDLTRAVFIFAFAATLAGVPPKAWGFSARSPLWPAKGKDFSLRLLIAPAPSKTNPATRARMRPSWPSCRRPCRRRFRSQQQQSQR